MSRVYTHEMDDGSTVLYSRKFETAVWSNSDGVLGIFEIPWGLFGDTSVFLPFILMEAEDDDADVYMFLNGPGFDDDQIEDLFQEIEECSGDDERFFDLMKEKGFIDDYELFYSY